MEKVKIIDLNHFKKYDELLKQWIASQFVYATEDDVLGLFETVTKETAPVDTIEELFLENLRKNFKNKNKISMIDLNSLTLYKEKMSSYIDENVLTFPTESKINSLFNEVHKYKIVIFNKPTGGGRYNTSAVSKLKLFKNNQELTVKSVKAINGSNATAILTDGEHNYTLTLAANSYYAGYPIRNVFNSSGWLSAGDSPTNMTLEFEMDNLTEISYRPCEEQTYNDGYGNENTITVFCDDEQVYHGNANISIDRRHSGYIHINFNDYDDVNVNIIYTA